MMLPDIRNIDTVLELSVPVNEKKIVPLTQAAGTQNLGIGWISNPYEQYSLGQYVRNGLSSVGSGISTQVFDFGTDIVVHAEFYDIGTCKTSSANFLIKLSGKDGKGVVKSSSNRYRTINSIGEAVSYISTRARSLSGRTNYND